MAPIIGPTPVEAVTRRDGFLGFDQSVVVVVVAGATNALRVASLKREPRPAEEETGK